jgi:hypothetical protein
MPFMLPMESICEAYVISKRKNGCSFFGENLFSSYDQKGHEAYSPYIKNPFNKILVLKFKMLLGKNIDNSKRNKTRHDSKIE